MRKSFMSAVVALALLVPAAWAQVSPQDTVLVEIGNVKLYRSDYDAELLKLPPDLRRGFGNDGRRVNDVLNRLVVQKVLAAQARDEKLAETAANAARMRIEMERVLAQMRIAAIEEQAGREFDARRGQFAARARELYIVDRKKYESPEQVSASHILFDLRKHSKEEGQRLAEEARAKAIAGADFNELAKQLSDDPSAKINSGRLTMFSRGEMDPAFADAAFALKKTGDISAPVLSQFGWHVIKLEERKPAGVKAFEDVRDVIIADQRRKYIDERREAALAGIRNDPAMKINQEAVDALVIRTDSEAVRRAVEEANKRAAPGAAPPK